MSAPDAKGVAHWGEQDSALPTTIAALFRAPRHVAAAPLPADWVSARAGRRKDGTEVEFHIRPQTGIAAAVRFRAFGCPWTLATCEWLAERLEGQSLGAAPAEGPIQWSAALGVPAERLGRLLVVEDALRSAWHAASR